MGSRTVFSHEGIFGNKIDNNFRKREVLRMKGKEMTMSVFKRFCAVGLSLVMLLGTLVPVSATGLTFDDGGVIGEFDDDAGVVEIKPLSNGDTVDIDGYLTVYDDAVDGPLDIKLNTWAYYGETKLTGEIRDGKIYVDLHVTSDVESLSVNSQRESVEYNKETGLASFPIGNYDKNSNLFMRFAISSSSTDGLSLADDIEALSPWAMTKTIPAVGASYDEQLALGIDLDNVDNYVKASDEFIQKNKADANNAPTTFKLIKSDEYFLIAPIADIKSGDVTKAAEFLDIEDFTYCGDVYSSKRPWSDDQLYRSSNQVGTAPDWGDAQWYTKLPTLSAVVKAFGTDTDGDKLKLPDGSKLIQTNSKSPSGLMAMTCTGNATSTSTGTSYNGILTVFKGMAPANGTQVAMMCYKKTQITSGADKGAWQYDFVTWSANAVDKDGSIMGQAVEGGFSIIIPKDTGKIEVVKEASNADLAKNNNNYSDKFTGLKFDIYDAETGGTKVDTITLGSDNKGTSDDLDYGTYWVQENEASIKSANIEGYYYDATRKKVVVDENRTDKNDVVSVKFVNINLMDPITILLEKKAKNGVPADKAMSLAGAEFSFKFYGLKKDEAITGTPMYDWVFRTQLNAQGQAMTMLWDDPRFKVSGPAIPLDATGEEALPKGWLVIQETKAPTGYKLPTPNPEIKVFIDPDDVLTSTHTVYNEPIVDNVEQRGGMTIDKTDVENAIIGDKETPQGDATFANTKFDIYNVSGYMVSDKNGKHIENNAKMETITTDSAGFWKSGLEDFQYGAYEFREIAGYQPLGYLNTSASNKLIIKVVVDKDKTMHNSTDDGKAINYIENDVIRGGFYIEKKETRLDENRTQGDAELDVTIEVYNRSEKPVVAWQTNKAGQANATWAKSGAKATYARGEKIMTVKLPNNGRYETMNNLLPYGSYEIIETIPGTGMNLAGTGNDGQKDKVVTRQPLTIREHGKIEQLKDARALDNEVIRGGIKVTKHDSELNKQVAQGAGDLASVFEIRNVSNKGVVVDGNTIIKSIEVENVNGVKEEVVKIDITPERKEYAPNELIATITLSPEGEWTSPTNWLPYGRYAVKEVTPPKGYLLDGKMTDIFTIREEGKIVEIVGTFVNPPIRGDVRAVKIVKEPQGGASDHNRLMDIPFTVTSKTTGEVHTIITDRNGEINTNHKQAIDLLVANNPSTSRSELEDRYLANINRGEFHYDGIWFGEKPIERSDLTKGALIYDTYIFEEQRHENNKDVKNLIVFEYTVSQHDRTINLGTMDNEMEPPMEIGTVAHGNNNEKQIVVGLDGMAKVTDTITYYNAVPKNEYQAIGWLVNSKTGEEIKDADGNRIEASSEIFKVVNVNGTIDVVFNFKASDVNIEEMTPVVYEELYLVTDGEIGEEPVAEHKDSEDVNQMFELIEPNPPSIGTKFTDFVSGASIVKPSADAKLVDTVSYENLPDGKYELQLTVMLKEAMTEAQSANNGENVPAVSATPSADVDVTPTPEVTVEPERDLPVYDEATGTWTHKTHGKYEVLKDKDGNPVTATLRFEVTDGQSTGEVQVPITVDLSQLAGRAIVAFEKLFAVGEDDTIGEEPIATHEDITDEGQTIEIAVPNENEEPKVPVIKTKATDKLSGTQIITKDNPVTIVDTVAYEGLTPGETYTLRGEQIVTATGEKLVIKATAAKANDIATTGANNETVTGTPIPTVTPDATVTPTERVSPNATVTPTPTTQAQTTPAGAVSDSVIKAFEAKLAEIEKTYTVTNEGHVVATKTFVASETGSGNVELEFTFDATQIADEEFKLTTYEYLYAGDKAEGEVIAEHANNMTDDEKVAQTVTIKNIALATTATGVDGKSEIAQDAKTVVIDKVEYKDAIVGQTYTMVGTLMDKKTGAPVGLPGTVSQTTFVADKADGVVEIKFEFDTTKLELGEYVAFERMYVGTKAEGNPVGTHEDINDESQTVTLIKETVTAKTVNETDTVKTGEDFPVIPVVAGSIALLGLAGFVIYFKKRKISG